MLGYLTPKEPLICKKGTPERPCCQSTLNSSWHNEDSSTAQIISPTLMHLLLNSVYEEGLFFKTA